jgi:transposase
MDEMNTATLAAGWDHIRYLKRSTKCLNQLIARCSDLVPNSIITVKGLGAVITAGILAEILDALHFSEEKHLAQYLSLTSRKYQEVSKYQHKRALVLTASKLVHRVRALLGKEVR